MMGKEIWLDPTEDETNAATATLVYAGMPALGTITSLSQNGRLTPQESIQVRPLSASSQCRLRRCRVHSA